MELSDANIVITDKAMRDTYNSKLLELSKSEIINPENTRHLNLYSNTDDVLKLKDKLKDHFFFIAGSSNFHHIDIANISRIYSKINQKLQLILIDQHMDCDVFLEDIKSLNCGNWVSYASRVGLVDRVVMIGNNDYRKNPRFDHDIEQKNKLLYHPNIENPFDIRFLKPDAPTYISIDTDILNVPSDWQKGIHDLESILNSPFWKQLSDFKLVGTCILGHVTDNRRTLDLIKKLSNKGSPTPKRYKFSQGDYSVTFKHLFFQKVKASLTSIPLPLEKQLEIILAFYEKIQSIR
ncbi:MAG: arginase family protein [Thermoplasmatales archaeon]|nr:arginase family protein [Thermoplasmatales archaeon]